MWLIIAYILDTMRQRFLFPNSPSFNKLSHCKHSAMYIGLLFTYFPIQILTIMFIQVLWQFKLYANQRMNINYFSDPGAPPCSSGICFCNASQNKTKPVLLIGVYQIKIYTTVVLVQWRWKSNPHLMLT